MCFQGVSYGKGAYFSRDASYSHRYATPNARNERFMFIASVLVGRTTLGNSTMVVPPDGKDIIVTYLDSQSYAKYLLTYQ